MFTKCRILQWSFHQIDFIQYHSIWCHKAALCYVETWMTILESSLWSKIFGCFLSMQCPFWISPLQLRNRFCLHFFIIDKNYCRCLCPFMSVHGHGQWISNSRATYLMASLYVSSEWKCLEKFRLRSKKIRCSCSPIINLEFDQKITFTWRKYLIKHCF